MILVADKPMVMSVREVGKDLTAPTNRYDWHRKKTVK